MFKSKTRITSAILPVVLLVGLGPAAINQAQQQQRPAAKLTAAERRKIHSTLHAGEYMWKKLAEMDPGKDIEIHSGRREPFSSASPAPTKNFKCAADVVVLGVVKDRSSDLTAKETFIFTDYTLLVEGVLKNNPAAELNPGDSIIVTRPGGTLILDGRKVKAVDGDYPPLRMAGRYLLFLRFISQTGAYSGLSTEDVSIDNPDQKAIDEARQGLIGCNGGGVP